LDSIGVDVKQRGTDVGTNDFNIDCPWCGKEKHLGIHRTTGQLNCWACQFAGMARRPWLASLIMELEGIPYSLAKPKAMNLIALSKDYGRDNDELFDRPSATWLPDNCHPFFCELKDKNQEGSQMLARSYLNERGLSDSDISRYKLRYTEVDLTGAFLWSGRVIVPFFESGELLSWIGRDYTDTSSLRYRNCPVEKSTRRPKELLYGLEEFKQFQLRHAVVVEGVFDKFTVGPTGLAISKGGASLEQQLLLSQLKLDSMSIIFDPTTWKDQYSLLRAVKLAQNLSSFIPAVKVVRLTTGDINEMGWPAVSKIEAATPVFQG
jgi:hypothetical protein